MFKNGFYYLLGQEIKDPTWLYFVANASGGGGWGAQDRRLLVKRTYWESHDELRIADRGPSLCHSQMRNFPMDDLPRLNSSYLTWRNWGNVAWGTESICSMNPTLSAERVDRPRIAAYTGARWKETQNALVHEDLMCSKPSLFRSYVRKLGRSPMLHQMLPSTPSYRDG